jgi:hypothetical protein
VRATLSGCSSVKVTADKDGNLSASAEGGLTNGWAARGGVGCVTASVMDKGVVSAGICDTGVVAVTTTVCVSRSSKERVGVGNGEVKVTDRFVGCRRGVASADKAVRLTLATGGRVTVASVVGLATGRVSIGVGVLIDGVDLRSVERQLVARKTAHRIRVL